MYITWQSDQYPYELCGKVKEHRGGGYYTVEGYDNMCFRAKRKIEDDRIGRQVQKALEKLEHLYSEELDNLSSKYMDKKNKFFRSLKGDIVTI